ncbi:hypothetical protein N865_18895 [Intrasporangium oryzae NRRL B-24470]|uniref:Uncharacterized protein n=1 Tax=Intrasporangium oryzae NRRL B-24470 TaxID=1386089 RepID=W9GAY7_9MICO|nr:hypothetical protein N865_18895 [Intrasporangium oryzae NRRL B-24470]
MREPVPGLVIDPVEQRALEGRRRADREPSRRALLARPGRLEGPTAAGGPASSAARSDVSNASRRS